MKLHDYSSPFETISRTWLTKILSTLLLFVVSAAQAQKVIPLARSTSDGLSVYIDSIQLAPLADTSHYGLQFRFAVMGGKVPQGEQVIISPHLSSGGNIANFPTMTIDNKWIYYHKLRGDRDIPPLPILYKDQNTTAYMHYGQTVVSADWMQSASLAFRVDRVSASGVLLSSKSFILRAPTPVYSVYKEADSYSEEIQHLYDRAYVDFPINLTKIYPNYHNNARELGHLRHTIDSVNRDSTIRIIRIDIKGYASPEGPYDNNDRLARGRTKSLARFIADSTNVPSSLFHTSYEAEDWKGLRMFVDTITTIGNREELLRIIDSNREPDAKLAYIKTTYPEEYAIIKKHALPYLRHTDTRIDYTLKRVQFTPGAERIDTIYRLQFDSLAIWPELCDGGASCYIPRRELLAIKTNLLFYGAYIPGYNRWAPIPNVALEYYPKKGHITAGASFDMPWYQDYDAHKYFQFRNYQLEGRYYFKSSTGANGDRPAFSGLYLSAYANAAIFGICFDAKRGWVGEGGGGGLGAGYVMPLSRNGHWRLEFSLQAGYFYCKYDPYQYENPINTSYHDNLYYYKWTNKPELFKKRQYRWSWFGPTRVGITLSYDLLYRRVQKRGVSFISKERRYHP